MDCVRLCVAVLEEMIDLLACCDDSNGVVGNIIYRAIGLLNEATNCVSQNNSDMKKIFNVIFSHAQNKIYDGWSDWRLDILNACVPLCYQIESRTKFEHYLSSFTSAKDEQDFSSRYLTTNIQKIKYELLDRFDGREIAEVYLEQNLENSDFRKIAIEKAISENKLERALELCFSGEQTDCDYAGLVLQWKEIRYVIYEKQNDISSQKNLAKEFVMCGEFEYYLKLKSLYDRKIWTEVMNEMVNTLENSKHKYGIYIEILIHEGLKLRLLNFCKQHPSYVVRLYPNIIPEFKSELNEIFSSFITKEAAHSSDRKQYHRVCGVIIQYAKACGTQGANILRNELLLIHKKCPAFIDELNKLKI